jgi:hypothetical protein
MADPRRDGDGGLARHDGRRAAAGDHGARTAPAADRAAGGGRRRESGTRGRRKYAAAALPGPDDQALPGGADVVQAVAGRPERRDPAAAHPGDRPGRPRGDGRAPRARAIRRQPGVPGPPLRAGGRAPEGTAAQDRRPGAGRAGRPAVGRGRRPGADRARRRLGRGPAAAGRPCVVLATGGPVVDPRVTERRRPAADRCSAAGPAAPAGGPARC